MAVIVFCQSLGIVAADEVTDAIRAEILATYDFSPHRLTSAEITRKSDVLDAFWTKAKARPEVYLPAVRQELAMADSPAFFLYDGSMLLLSLSDTPADRRVALATIARCDLKDVQSTAYLRSVHRLAGLGEDTTAAAMHVLDSPGFQAFIPQHALTLGQDYSLVYMLLPTDPAFWLEAAVERLAREPDATAQRSLLLLLWYAQTAAADAAVERFSKDASKGQESRDRARELLDRKQRSGLLAAAAALLTTEEALRATRREVMRRLSDEALIELDQVTMQIVAKRK